MEQQALKDMLRAYKTTEERKDIIWWLWQNRGINPDECWDAITELDEETA